MKQSNSLMAMFGAGSATASSGGGFAGISRPQQIKLRPRRRVPEEPLDAPEMFNVQRSIGGRGRCMRLRAVPYAALLATLAWAMRLFSRPTDFPAGTGAAFCCRRDQSGDRVAPNHMIAPHIERRERVFVRRDDVRAFRLRRSARRATRHDLPQCSHRLPFSWGRTVRRRANVLRAWIAEMRRSPI